MTYRYCDTDDLVFGNIPVPTDADSWIQKAMDEVDSYVGHIYSTPIIFSSGPAGRPGKLLINRICAWLATGRAILALGSGGSDANLQAYGNKLVTDAVEALQAIVDGRVTLIGVEALVVADDESARPTAPLIAQVDEESFVEAFGATFGNPIANVLNTERCYPTISPANRG